jgi:hypothetical protein
MLTKLKTAQQRANQKYLNGCENKLHSSPTKISEYECSNCVHLSSTFPWVLVSLNTDTHEVGITFIPV